VHTEVSEALGAYVLGALPADERLAVERHLEVCERCSEAAASLRVAVNVLPASVPIVEPPRELKDRIMAVVTAEAELLRAAGSEADRPPRRRPVWRPEPGWLGRRPLATAGMAAALAAAAAGGVIVLGEGSGGERSPRVSSERVVSAQITDADIARRARASVRVKGTRASLVVRNLPGPGANRVYQVWLKRSGSAPVPAGATFRVRSGSVDIPRAMRPSEQMLVTVEPAGGSREPTGPALIVAQPA
jgi:anti-sigma-K factor RskA